MRALEIIRREAAKRPGSQTAWRAFVDTVRSLCRLLIGRDPRHPEQIAASLVARGVERLPKVQHRLTANERARLAKKWREIAALDGSFQHGRSQSKNPRDVARAVSLPGRTVTARMEGDALLFERHDGRTGETTSITVEDTHLPAPEIYALVAGVVGEEKSGGSQLYMAALDWMHNNGKVPHNGVLTEINRVRRTSLYLASALRWGTTRHLKPHPEQNVAWSESDDDNIAALAHREMLNVFETIKEARNWSFDFEGGTIVEGAGSEVLPETLAYAISTADPARTGIGESTLTRAIVTSSILNGAQPLSILPVPPRILYSHPFIEETQ